MAHKGWYEALDNALQKEDMAVMQFATIDSDPSNNPCVRTLVHRAFITAHAFPALPLILTTTDIRAPKVAQLSANRIVEIAYWTPSTQAQFRILGRASVLSAPEWQSHPLPGPSGVVCDALAREGLVWEEKRRETFNLMNGHLRATFCRPVSGTPLTGGDDEMRRWPKTLPRLGEGTESEEERRHLEVAFGNFALLLVEPFEVDYLALADEVRLDRRTLYRRDWEDEHNVEFKETLVVP